MKSAKRLRLVNYIYYIVLSFIVCYHKIKTTTTPLKQHSTTRVAHRSRIMYEASCTSTQSARKQNVVFPSSKTSLFYSTAKACQSTENTARLLLGGRERNQQKPNKTFSTPNFPTKKNSSNKMCYTHIAQTNPMRQLIHIATEAQNFHHPKQVDQPNP